MFPKNSCIVDFQGFQWKTSEFMCKEFAIKHLNFQTDINHYLFNFPFDLEHFQNEIQRHFKFLTDNIHGLEWTTTKTSAAAVLPYTDLVKIIHNQIISKKVNMIFVKGDQKVAFLRKYVPASVLIVDLENSPPFWNINNDNLPSKCSLHRTRESTRRCSVNIVNYLYECLIWNKR